MKCSLQVTLLFSLPLLLKNELNSSEIEMTVTKLDLEFMYKLFSLSLFTNQQKSKYNGFSFIKFIVQLLQNLYTTKGLSQKHKKCTFKVLYKIQKVSVYHLVHQSLSKYSMPSSKSQITLKANISQLTYSTCAMQNAQFRICKFSILYIYFKK